MLKWYVYGYILIYMTYIKGENHKFNTQFFSVCLYTHVLSFLSLGIPKKILF